VSAALPPRSAPPALSRGAITTTRSREVPVRLATTFTSWRSPSLKRSVATSNPLALSALATYSAALRSPSDPGERSPNRLAIPRAWSEAASPSKRMSAETSADRVRGRSWSEKAATTRARIAGRKATR